MEAQRNHQTTWRAGIGRPDAFSVRECGVNKQYPLIRVTVVNYLRLCIGDGGIRLQTKKSHLAVAFFLNLAETVGFAHIMRAACAQVCAQLRIPHVERAGAPLVCTANEKKATLRWLFS